MASLKSLLLFLSVFCAQVVLPSLCLAGIIEHDCGCPAAVCDHEEACPTDPCQISILKSEHKILSAALASAEQPAVLRSTFVLSLKVRPVSFFTRPRLHSADVFLYCAYPSTFFPLLI
jgi:hypothetical protein